CGLAITESERTLPGLIDQFEGMLKDAGLADQQVSVRMTGCPNGCARPYNSDIGLVGRSGTKYTLFVGGSHRGDRLSFVLQDLVERDQVVPLVRKLVDRFKVERGSEEGFGDWCTRQGGGRGDGGQGKGKAALSRRTPKMRRAAARRRFLSLPRGPPRMRAVRATAAGPSPAHFPRSPRRARGAPRRPAGTSGTPRRR